ncbi:MAG: VOC family protein [Chlamydiota bacterium]|nr:VOC family protein [Chlamydiota bacterium]
MHTKSLVLFATSIAYSGLNHWDCKEPMQNAEFMDNKNPQQEHSKEVALPARTYGIRHIALRVRDIARAETFYCNILGFQIVWRPDEHNLYLSSGFDNLALHQESTMNTNASLDHFGIIVQSADQIDVWHQHLLKNNIPLSKAPKTHRDGARSLYLQDPEGNMIQILYHPDISHR